MLCSLWADLSVRTGAPHHASRWISQENEQKAALLPKESGFFAPQNPQKLQNGYKFEEFIDFFHYDDIVKKNMYAGDEYMKRRKLFCEYNRVFYRISLRKEYLRRDVKDLFSPEKIARCRRQEDLPALVKAHRSVSLRRLEGVDPVLQENKVTNLRLAASKVDGLIIAPGETFSFWKTVGPTTRRRGYKEGLIIMKDSMAAGYGGGICQMANMIHWLVLNSPLSVTELHHHTDALFPDERRRVPFGTGTSVFYKNVDYRFKNTTDQPVQLRLWLDETDLCGELRALRPFPLRYRIEEEDHHFRREGEDWYRISRVYRLAFDRETGEQTEKKLILDNHSKVMYDPSLIPIHQIREV